MSSALPPSRRERRRREPAGETRGTRLLAAAFTVLSLLAIGSLIPTPYVVMSPGPAVNTLGKLERTPLISVKGKTTYPTDGALDFTTVRVKGGPGNRPSLGEVAVAAVMPHDEVFPEEMYFPKGTTEKDVKEENTAEMVGSQQEAIYVALNALGERITRVPVVASVPDDSPAKDRLRAGDRILAVGGTKVADAKAVQSAIRAVTPGSPLTLSVERDGKPVEVTTTTRSIEGRTTVGIMLGSKFVFPYDVTINAGDVGGPSAGMMFSLAVYDVLTPGKLTGGKEIAGTGTIAEDGSVGPIGGIRQKVVGARDSGADYFLAPAENCAELMGAAPDGLTVVKVASFTEARTAVERIAAGKAEGLARCG
ncbi:MAG: PDZ domain-containing protein [Micrococcales bacterium]|nr:PDZ domain-containing protein [Micrococcales bacterium]